MRLPPLLLLPLLAAFVIASRTPYWTPHPPHFDFANFTLGVRRFAPLDHQPHPPGYPLVILMAQGFAAIGLSTVRALHWTAMVGSLCAVAGVYQLGRSLSSQTGGLLAALLLALDPVFWFSGVNSPTRAWLAAGVSWLLYGAVGMARGRAPWLWLTAMMLAVGAGFRQELPLLLAAPLVLAARLGGIAWRRIGLAAALALAASLPWVLWMARGFGSLPRMLYVYYHYFLHHISTSSAPFGAPESAWQMMLRQCLAWNGLAGATFVLALLASRRRASLDRRFLAMAACYFVPAALLQLLIHIGFDSPDHALGTITVLWVSAGSLLAVSRSFWVAAPAAAAALWISFAAPGARLPDWDMISLRTFVRDQRAVADLLAGLRATLRPGDAIVVLDDSPVTARILGCELKQVPIVILGAGLGTNPNRPPEAAVLVGERQTAVAPDAIPLPGVNRLHVIAHPAGRQIRMVRERLCASCPLDGWRLEVRPDTQVVSLPPFTLRL